MIKKFCAIIVLIVAANFSVTFAALDERLLDAPVFDVTQSLSSTEINILTEKVRNIEQKHQIKIGIEFMDSIGNADIGNAARYLREQHFNDGRNGNILLLVVMDQRNWYISTDSKINSRLGSVSDLGNAFVSRLSNGDYYGACNGYIDAVDQVLTYYEQNGVAYDSSAGFNPMAAMVAVVLGILFGMMFRSWLMGSMSNVRPAVAATDYLKRETVKFDVKRDTYLYTNVARRPKPRGGHNGGAGGMGGGRSGRGGGAGGGF